MASLNFWPYSPTPTPRALHTMINDQAGRHAAHLMTTQRRNAVTHMPALLLSTPLRSAACRLRSPLASTKQQLPLLSVCSLACAGTGSCAAASAHCCALQPQASSPAACTPAQQACCRAHPLRPQAAPGKAAVRRRRRWPSAGSASPCWWRQQVPGYARGCFAVRSTALHQGAVLSSAVASTALAARCASAIYASARSASAAKMCSALLAQPPLLHAAAPVDNLAAMQAGSSPAGSAQDTLLCAAWAVCCGQRAKGLCFARAGYAGAPSSAARSAERSRGMQCTFRMSDVACRAGATSSTTSCTNPPGQAHVTRSATLALMQLQDRGSAWTPRSAGEACTPTRKALETSRT